MSATAGLLRCCCQGQPTTCQQVLSYCPEYLQVNIPEFRVKSQLWLGSGAGGTPTYYTVTLYNGCYYGPPGTPCFAYYPPNELIADYEAKFSASQLLFKRMTTNSATNCQQQCNTCARYCLLRGPAQTGVFTYDYRMERAWLYYDISYGGTFPLVRRTAHASGSVAITSLPTHEQANIVGKINTTQLASNACQHQLDFTISSSRMLSYYGATNDGFWCPCCGPGTIPANCLLYPEQEMNLGFILQQKWISPGPPAISCPGTTTPIEAIAAPGSYLSVHSVNLLDPSASSWNAPYACGSPRFNVPITCRGLAGGAGSCDAHECFANGPASITAA